ncbi:Serine protease easter, partial [Armadillidium nasatum]
SAHPRNLLISEPKKSLLPENCGRPRVRNKIFGGTPTPIGAYPWVVALGYRVYYNVIKTNKIIAVIQLGTWNLDSDEDCIEDRNSRQRRCFSHIVSGFEDIVIHPTFDKEAEFADDIALIRLNITLSFDRDDNVLIRPVCLPSSDLRVRDYGRGRMAIGAGWGLTEHKNYSSVLMSVELPIVNNKHCVRRYKRQFVGNQLCAGGERGKDTCIGDSGGPLVLSDPFGPPFTQVGIVSFGQTPCGGKSTPGVYTSVARYRKWIENNLKP